VILQTVDRGTVNMGYTSVFIVKIQSQLIPNFGEITFL
jgi:hypothetical protein